MQLVNERILIDATALGRVVRRMAVETIEKSEGLDNLVLVGIHTGGVHLCERIANAIEEVEGERPNSGRIDITLYRDDAFLGLPRPVIGETRIPNDSIAGKTVVLVDDVLFTGRTVRAALNALLDFGRPSKILLAVLVDRGRRELPVQADIVGYNVTTGPMHVVEAELKESGGTDQVVLYKRRTDAQEGGA
ncbi:MAG: bifunctional pyr operon transcriptional regulator/uracil phosphoribosyltransferase [Myxococcales bacterium]|mgnify:CR=1 FL=1|nr:bifunctional pyr operon transcriptional regulator/uracil phosphoribosyltransferase [Myxococcales bacterium]